MRLAIANSLRGAELPLRCSRHRLARVPAWAWRPALALDGKPGRFPAGRLCVPRQQRPQRQLRLLSQSD